MSQSRRASEPTPLPFFFSLLGKTGDEDSLISDFSVEDGWLSLSEEGSGLHLSFQINILLDQILFPPVGHGAGE